MSEPAEHPTPEQEQRALALDQELMAATLHFSETWEDARTDLLALRPQSGDRVLSITAGGCTPLSLLATDPVEVVSVDYNPSQTYLLELKIAAIRHLPREAVGPFLDQGLGFEDIYPLLNHDLRPEAAVFWREREEHLALGIARQGIASRIFYRIGAFLQKAFKKPIREGFFEIEDLEEQKAYYRKYFHYPILRGLSSLAGRWLSHPAVLKRLFGADYFPYATIDNVPAHIWQRIEHVMTEVPALDNYFLARVLLSHELEDPEGRPPYLRFEDFPKVRARLDRLRPVTAPIEEALRDLEDDSVDCFQLSNVFEWMPEDKLDSVFEDVLRAARPGARLFLRNLFTRRDIPASARHRITIDDELSERLYTNDRSFIYSRSIVATVGS